MSGPSLLDAHLAEIDRRLRAIQCKLEPAACVPGLGDEEIGEPVAADLRLPPAELVAADVQSPAAQAVAVSAGPFDGTEALARFERALAELPGVSDVTLREFEGADRAVFEVLLGAPIA